MGWGSNMSKNPCPPFLLVFDFEPKKCPQVPTPQALCGAEWDERSCSLCSF